MVRETKLFEYPVYALAYGDGYIVTSGGGGGVEYGISDKLEIYGFNEAVATNELHLKATTSDVVGILDNVDFSPLHKLWIGSTDDSSLFFSYNPSLGTRVFGKLKTDYTEKLEAKQNVCRLSKSSDLFITAGNDHKVKVWKLSNKLVNQLREFQGVEYIDEKYEASTDEPYPPTTLNSPVTCNDVIDQSESSPAQAEELKEEKPDLAPVERTSSGETVEKQLKRDDSLGAKAETPDSVLSRTSSSVIILKNPEDDLANKVFDYEEHEKSVNDCCLSNDLKLIISVCSDNFVVYQMDPPKLITKHKCDGTSFKFCRFLKSNLINTYKMITVEWTKTKPNKTTVSTWSINMDDKVLKKLRSVKTSDNQCSTLILSDDHAHFAIGYGTGAVSLYATENLSHIRTENRHMLPVTDIAFTRNKLISSGADFYVIIDNIKKGPSTLDYITLLVPIVALGICLVKMSYVDLFENIERFFKTPFLR